MKGNVGLLVDKQIREEILNKEVLGRIYYEDIQPSSLDVRTGDKYWILPASIKPQKDSEFHFEDVLNKLSLDNGELKSNNGLLVPKNTILVVESNLELNLKEMNAIASPKSSIGRIDVLVRALCDNSDSYDFIPNKTKGKLYLEIVPLSFPIKIYSGIPLTQLRFFNSDSGSKRIELLRKDIELILRKHNLMYFDDKPIKPEFLDDSLIFHLDLSDEYIWKAKDNVYHAIDLKNINYYDVKDFFDKVYVKRINNRNYVILDRNSFYILSTKEKISVPWVLSAFLKPITLEFGKVSNNYAGYIDPGFGYSRDGSLKGSHIVLEIRTHDVSRVMYDNTEIALLDLYVNKTIPEKPYGIKESNYYNQKINEMSKFFKKD